MRFSTSLFLLNMMCGPAASKVKPFSTIVPQRPPMLLRRSTTSTSLPRNEASATPEMPPPRMPMERWIMREAYCSRGGARLDLLNPAEHHQHRQECLCHIILPCSRNADARESGVA